ncbi:MAG: TIGR02285 family protein [Geobacteraceae bacterium]|nr:TIGR02285 family protein [Geobacteraceae bacterium]
MSEVTKERLPLLNRVKTMRNLIRYIWSMHSVCFPALFSFFLLIAATPTVQAKETLVWSVIDFPPFQILDGTYAASGSFDGELQTLMDKLPEFEHTIVRMSFARRKQEFLNGSHICTPGIFFAPAKELHLAVSKPALTHLDNRVIFLKSKAALFGRGNPVDLEALFKRKNLIGGIVAGRSYAPNIDATIRRYKDSPNLVIRALSGDQLFQMLLNGDLDYLIMFSHEAAFQNIRMGLNDTVLNRSIAGTPPYLYTYVACTGDDWGHAVINKVNAVLSRERGKDFYKQFSERWYPEEDRKKVRRYYPLMLAD